MSETTTLIPPAFLFRLSVPCLYTSAAWTSQGCVLDGRYVMTSFHAELNGGPRFAELRLGWNERGLLVNLMATGKQHAPWCRDSRLEDSDGLTLLIDTRDTQSIHRAGRFCHRFVLLPQGAGRLLSDPVAALLPIQRARENPRLVPREALPIRSEKRTDGYALQGFIPAEALTGFEASEHPRLGFSYAVIDRELGWQTFSLGPEFPFLSDPSLWGSLELTARPRASRSQKSRT